jgi:hypothetical protein
VKPLWTAAAVWALASAAQAQVFAGPPTAASVTIYRDGPADAAGLAELDPSQGLAMITETRVVDAPAAGRVRIAFRGVADTMVPETVAIAGLPGAMVERNEDFAVLSPGSLVAHSLGQAVRVVQTGPGKAGVSQRTATLRSGPAGVLLDFGGGVEALGCGGPPTRLIFDRAPPELSDKPAFSVLADLPRAGRYTVKLSYLATGFSWSADYVAHIRPDGRTLDLEAWLTLANKSAAGFDQAPTQVVAGQLMRDAATRPPQPQADDLTPECWGQSRPVPPPPSPEVQYRMVAAAPRADLQEMVVTARKQLAIQGELGDYKLYTLPEPTRVAARQTKQVAFLDQKAVPFTRVYVYRFDESDAQPDAHAAADVVLRLENRKAAGLGKPLPSGTVSVLAPSARGPVLAGEQRIEDTPVGLPLELTLGRAMDVAVRPKVLEERRTGDQVATTVAVAFENDKPEPITVEHRQPQQGRDFKLASESQASTTDKGDRVWTFRLAPGQRAELTYAMAWRW